MEWINHISRDMSLASIYYPYLAYTIKSSIFKSDCPDMVYFAKGTFIKGYKSKRSHNKIIQQIKEIIQEGKLKDILLNFKRIINARDNFINSFIKTDLNKVSSNLIVDKLETFHRLYTEYWVHHIFAFNLGHAVEGTLYEKEVKLNEKLIKEVRGVNPYLIYDEKFLPHLFNFISKKAGIEKSLLFYLNPKEIITYFKDKKDFDINELNERKKYYLLMKLNTEEYFYSGEKALIKYTEIVPAENYKLTEIKGVIAFQGRVKGKVRKVILKKDLKEVKKGEILVTHQTTPEYGIILDKVTAIVTDEGGMLSHAAIISREMKIPCVIGTRFATKIFNDGECIEVDAIKGLVRKIK